MNPSHRLALGVALILLCVVYTTLAIATPEVATALAVGYIPIVLVVGIVLRLSRRI